MLVLHVIFAFLSGFGLFSLLWVVMGFFLPSCREGLLLCTNREFVLPYLWLRGFGIVTCPLVVLDEAMDEDARTKLAEKGIEVHSPEMLSGLLGKDIP